MHPAYAGSLVTSPQGKISGFYQSELLSYQTLFWQHMRTQLMIVNVIWFSPSGRIKVLDTSRQPWWMRRSNIKNKTGKANE